MKKSDSIGKDDKKKIAMLPSAKDDDDDDDEDDDDVEDEDETESSFHEARRNMILQLTSEPIDENTIEDDNETETVDESLSKKKAAKSSSTTAATATKTNKASKKKKKKKTKTKQEQTTTATSEAEVESGQVIDHDETVHKIDDSLPSKPKASSTTKKKKKKKKRKMQSDGEKANDNNEWVEKENERAVRNGARLSSSSDTMIGAVAVKGIDADLEEDEHDHDAMDDGNDSEEEAMPGPPELLENVTTTAVPVDEEAYEEEIRDRIRRESVIASSILTVDSKRESRRVCSKAETVFILSLMFVFAVIAFGVGVGFARSSKSSDATDGSQLQTTAVPIPLDSQDSDDSETAPVFGVDNLPAAIAEALEYIKSISEDNGASIEIEGTPQYKAFNWLAKDYAISKGIENQRSRYALAVLYFATDGENWNNNAGWLQEENTCDWWFDTDSPCEGGRGGVRKIYLNNNNLKGTLPPEVKIFDFFGYELKLSDNRLSGDIPISLFQTTKLTEIDLSRNEFSGSIPNDGPFGSELTRLYLNDNNLIGQIPSQIESCTDLETIRLDNNQLTGTIPASLGNIGGLNNARFDDNLFSSQNLDPIFCDDVFHIWEELSSDCDRSTTDIQCTCCTFCGK